MTTNQTRNATKSPITKYVTLNAELMDAIEAFRSELLPDVDQSEAIRTILRSWLADRGYIAD